MPRYHSSYIQSLLESEDTFEIPAGEKSYRADSTPKSTFIKLKQGKVPIDKRFNFRGMRVADVELMLDEMMQKAQKASQSL